jgi:xanthine dehydrogenase accessory factor
VSILAELVASRPRGAAAVPGPRAAEPPAEATDPVCGMTVAVADSSLHAEHAGRTWYFCGTGCQRAFADDPARYPG